MQQSAHIRRMETDRLAALILILHGSAYERCIPPSLLLAILTLTCACSKAAPAPDPVRGCREGPPQRREDPDALTALPPACTLGSAAHMPQGRWLTAPKAMTEPGHPYTFIQQFDEAATTGTVRAALNRAALAALDKVEFRDAQGKWVDAGPAGVHEAPAGCDYVWLQQDLGGARRIDALRYTFHRSEAPVTLANAALFTSN
jgi:hypothetical protein